VTCKLTNLTTILCDAIIIVINTTLKVCLAI